MRDGAQWSNRLPEAAAPGLVEWLADDGLLTPRLRSRRPSGFHLALRAEYRRALYPGERGLLGVVDGDAQVREIIMGDTAGAMVVAASVIPATTLERFPALACLGDRPLGEALASRDDVTREPFQYAVFQPGDSDYPQLPPAMPIEKLFARRSVIRVDSAPILVVEYFRSAIAVQGGLAS